LYVWLVVVGCALEVSGQAKAKVYGLEFPGNDQLPGGIAFFCAENYPLNECKQHALILRKVLEHYPVQRLAPWSFILVPAGNWEELLHIANGQSGSPAFSALRSHDTFMSESLFAPSKLEQAIQVQLFGRYGADLLDFTVSHELGHAFCQELNESRAEDCARQLRALRTAKLPALHFSGR
jgi:hypothetical protein